MVCRIDVDNLGTQDFHRQADPHVSPIAMCASKRGRAKIIKFSSYVTTKRENNIQYREKNEPSVLSNLLENIKKIL